MPFKDPEKRRKYRREWYAKNKESEKAHVKRRKIQLRKWLRDYKKKLKCSKCSENHPATLEFHHKPNYKKERAISGMLTNGSSIKNTLKEMEKCIVLCSNCHKKEHYGNNNL